MPIWDAKIKCLIINNLVYDEKKTKIGYEISFTKYFYKPVELRPLQDIVNELHALETETEGLLIDIVKGL